MSAKAPTAQNGADSSEGIADRITIPAPAIVQLEVTVRGVSPLITHAWSDKAKKQMLDKQMQKAKQSREAKDPERDFRESLYPMNGEDGADGYGFPAVAFKAAAVRAGKQVGLVMTDLRTWFHVSGELVPLDADEPVMREDMVRLPRSTDIRYRGQFTNWSATIPVELDESKLSVEQLVSLLANAGFGVGVGEWRPEKCGQYGRFEVLDVRKVG